jgi:hypothetical protein
MDGSMFYMRTRTYMQPVASKWVGDQFFWLEESAKKLRARDGEKIRRPAGQPIYIYAFIRFAQQIERKMKNERAFSIN